MTTTYVAAAAGEAFIVTVEVTPSGGTYAAPATINAQRSLEMMANADANVIARTDDPSKPGKTTRTVVSVDWKCSGQGTLNVGDDKVWADWLLSGISKNVQVSNAVTGALVLTGPAVLTQLSLTADGLGKKVMGSITLEGADLPVSTAHA